MIHPMNWLKVHGHRTARVGLYITYFVVGVSYPFSNPLSLKALLGSGYYVWATTLLISTALLLLGVVIKNEWVEVIGTLPTAIGSVVYSVALLLNPPNGEFMLGVGASALVGVNFWWLVMRFLEVYPYLGTNERRRTQ